ncbi:MAG: hypothetical protein KC506_01295, partial [Nanoarchaeota archaeon]|nr:hypothetical protein [Nanoarchaeota archaeon]
QHSLKELALELFPERFKDNKDFTATLSDYFKVLNEKIVETKHTYHNLDKAEKLFKFEMGEFFGRKVEDSHKEQLIDFLKKHEDNGKFVMGAQMRLILCENRL